MPRRTSPIRRPCRRVWLMGTLLSASVLLAACSSASQPHKPPSTTVKAPAASRSLKAEAGDCVDWNENDANATLTAVDCSNPHHFEVAGKLKLEDSDYPGDDAISAKADESCAPIVTGYLGQPLDPEGRFQSDTLLPSSEGWKAGDRNVFCGVTELSPPDDQAQRVEIRRTGTARGVDQTQLTPPGVCLVTTGNGVVLSPCDQPHDYEIVGETTLAQFPPGAPQPKDEEFWALGEGQACASSLQTYLGRPAAADEHTYARPMPHGSWQLGRRRVECVALKLGPDGRPLKQQASLRTQQP